MKRLPTPRERHFMLRCGLAVHHTSPPTRLNPPVTHEEIRVMILEGWVTWQACYRLTRAGEKIVGAQVKALLNARQEARP